MRKLHSQDNIGADTYTLRSPSTPSCIAPENFMHVSLSSVVVGDHKSRLRTTYRVQSSSRELADEPVSS